MENIQYIDVLEDHTYYQINTHDVHHSLIDHNYSLPSI